MPGPICISIAPSVKAATEHAPQTFDDFANLLNRLLPHVVTDNKESVPVYSTAQFKDMHRGLGNVQRLGRIIVLDLDHVDSFPSLKELGIPHALISSHSHSPQTGDNCARLIVELDREPSLEEWPRFWAFANWLLTENQADKSCKDPSRCFFFPTVGPGNQLIAEVHLEGSPLQVAMMHEMPDAELQFAPTKIDPSEIIPADVSTLEEIFKTWKKTKSTSLREKAALGNRIIKGEPLAVSERHKSLRDLFWAIVHTNPETMKFDGESIAALCQESVEASQVPTKKDITFDEVWGLWDSACENATITINEQKQEKRTALENAIREIFKTRKPKRDKNGVVIRGQMVWETGRTEFVSPKEMKHLQEQFGTETMERVKNHFVLHTKNANYFLRPDGRVHPVPFESMMLPSEAPKFLSPFFPYADVKGWKTDEIIREHGTQVSNMVYTYVGESTFDQFTRTLTMQVGRTFDGPAKAHPEIMQWLHIITEANQHKGLIDWLSLVPDLTQPRAALVLEGEPGTGKTLLAYMVARYWGEDMPVDIDGTTGDFQEEILRCPVILADEHPGKDYARQGTKYIRHQVAIPSRTIARKHQTHAKILGALNFIFTCNNIRVFSTSQEEDIKDTDLDAFCERMLHVHLPKAAHEYILSIEQNNEIGYIQKSWIDDGKALETIKWIHENHEISKDSRGRFAVTGQKGGAFHRLLLAQHGLRAEVLAWCYQFFAWRMSEKRDNTKFQTQFIKISGGKLWTNGEAIYQHWHDAFGQDSRPPALARIQRVVADFSVGQGESETIEQIRIEGRRMWAIDPEILLVGAETSAIGREGVQRGLMDDRPNIRKLNNPTPQGAKPEEGKNVEVHSGRFRNHRFEPK